jgi:hypothetical protein
MATQAVRDACWNYCQQNNLEATVIKGKSNITRAKERIVVGASDSIAKIFRIDKPKARAKDHTGSPQDGQIRTTSSQWWLIAL